MWAPGEGSETPDRRRDHLIHRKRSPFPYEGKALTPLIWGETAQHAASEALPRMPAGRSPAPPAAMRRWGGLEGFTPPHNLRRGQRLPTDSEYSPAPRVSAGLNFAVILLSKAMNVGRDHLT